MKFKHILFSFGWLVLGGGLIVIGRGCAHSSYIGPVERSVTRMRPESEADASSIGMTVSSQELWVIPMDGPSSAEPDPTRAVMKPGNVLVIEPIQERSSEPIIPDWVDSHVDIRAFLAHTELAEQWNHLARTELELRLSMPAESVVGDFEMTIGSRHIRGIIRPREQAQKIFDAAQAHNYTASFLTESGNNQIIGRIGNIENGQRLQIRMAYDQSLTFNDGWLEYLCAGGPMNTLDAHLDAGPQNDGIEKIETPDNASSIIKLSPTAADIHMSNPGAPIRIRYRLPDRSPRAMYVAQDDELGGGYGAVMVIPGAAPAASAAQSRTPIAVSILVDDPQHESASEHARAIVVARQLVTALHEGDDFRIAAASAPFEPVPAFVRVDHTAVLQALEKLELFDKSESAQRAPADGAPANDLQLPECIAALASSTTAKPPAAHDLRRQYIVVMSSGAGADARRCAAVAHDRLGESRLFIVSVGTVPAPSNLCVMARCPGVGLIECGVGRETAVATDLVDRLFSPALAQVTLGWSGAPCDYAINPRAGDAYRDRAMTAYYHFLSRPPDSVSVTAQAGTQNVTMTTTALRAAKDDFTGLDRLWARRRISELAMRHFIHADESLLREIQTLAIEHADLSPFTAFLCVDATQRGAASNGN